MPPQPAWNRQGARPHTPSYSDAERTDDPLRPLVGSTALLVAHGARHAAYRQVVGPGLRGGRLNAYRPAVLDIVERAADELTRTEAFVVPEWARRVALRIVGRILFGDEE